MYLPSISCPTFWWELWNVVTCQDWTRKRVKKCQAGHVLHLDKVHVLNNLWISQGPGGEGALCVSITEWQRLRVGGERSEQNLRHVLLAKGHQQQRQALIGWIHAATLKTDVEEGRRVSATKTTQTYVMEVEMFKKNSATPCQRIEDWLSQGKHR